MKYDAKQLLSQTRSIFSVLVESADKILEYSMISEKAPVTTKSTKRFLTDSEVFAIFIELYLDYLKGKSASTLRNLAKRTTHNQKYLTAAQNRLRSKIARLEEMGLVEVRTVQFVRNVNSLQITAREPLAKIFEQIILPKLYRIYSFDDLNDIHIKKLGNDRSGQTSI